MKREIRFAVGEQGGVVVKGENVMAGYWKNERATAGDDPDGWLYTGDLGYLDARWVSVCSRQEQKLVDCERWRKYSPEGNAETIIGHSPFIEQIMLYNNQSPYTVALVVPNREAMLRRLTELKLSCHTPEGQKRASRSLEPKSTLTATEHTPEHFLNAGTRRLSRCLAKDSRNKTVS